MCAATRVRYEVTEKPPKGSPENAKPRQVAHGTAVVADGRLTPHVVSGLSPGKVRWRSKISLSFRFSVYDPPCLASGVLSALELMIHCTAPVHPSTLNRHDNFLMYPAVSGPLDFNGDRDSGLQRGVRSDHGGGRDYIPART